MKRYRLLLAGVFVFARCVGLPSRVGHHANAFDIITSMHENGELSGLLKKDDKKK